MEETKLTTELPLTGSGVEAGVDAGAAAQHPRPSVDDAVGGNEGLRRSRRGGVREADVEVLHVRDVGVAVRGTAPLQHQHAVVPREGGRQGAPAGSAANNYVVESLLFCLREAARFVQIRVTMSMLHFVAGITSCSE